MTAHGQQSVQSTSPFNRVSPGNPPPQITPVASLDRTEAERLTIEAIQQAKSVIVFAQPTIRSRSIAEALLEARDRGIYIAGIMDPNRANEATVSRFLIKKNIPIMHWQGEGVPLPSFTVIDYQVVLIGQYTWDKTAVAMPLLRVSEYGTGATYHNFWNDLQQFSEIDDTIINNIAITEDKK